MRAGLYSGRVKEEFDENEPCRCRYCTWRRLYRPRHLGATRQGQLRCIQRGQIRVDEAHRKGRRCGYTACTVCGIGPLVTPDILKADHPFGGGFGVTGGPSILGHGFGN